MIAKTQSKLDGRDPLRATPVVMDDIEVKEGAAGCLQLRASPAPGRGLSGILARNLRLQRATRVKLDERGTFFWKQIDGERTLKDIERRQRQQYSLGEKESTEATVEFTQMLMLRGLIGLRLPENRETDERA